MENKKNRGLNELFNEGEIFSASNEELKKALEELTNGFVANAGVRHREIIRGFVINAILNQRHIESIESRNRKLTWLIIILTSVSIILSIVGFIFKIKI